jgi:hypothetical protein
MLFDYFAVFVSNVDYICGSAAEVERLWSKKRSTKQCMARLDIA